MKLKNGVPPLEDAGSDPPDVYDSKIEKRWPDEECCHWKDSRTGKEVEWPKFGPDEREVVVTTRQGRELRIYRCEEDETLQAKMSMTVTTFLSRCTYFLTSSE